VGLTSSPAFGAIGNTLSPERRLSLYNTHTGEKLETVYWASGEYLPDALSKINHILRDHRTGRVRPIDMHLLDILHALSKKLCAKQPFHIISGYRSPETNKLLRYRSKKVASKSLHMKGKAICTKAGVLLKWEGERLKSQSASLLGTTKEGAASRPPPGCWSMRFPVLSHGNVAGNSEPKAVYEALVPVGQVPPPV
jgi:hypothetical protein